MKFQRTVLAGMLVLFAVTAAMAQNGGLKVVVFDAQDKQPLPGVTVTLRNSMQYVATTTVLTDKAGTALFPVLRAGAGYSVEVSFPGYAKQQATDLHVKSSETVTQTFVLTQEMTEKVVVQGQREVVDLEKSSTSTKFGEEFIQDLPVQGRFYQNILTMAAGVQDPQGGGNPNVMGGQSTQFKAQVGGVSNQDPLTGEWMSVINPDSIEEVEVITAGASVEYSRAMAGFANIIQKQGSNDFEGAFNFLYSSDILDRGAVDSPGYPRPRYTHLQPAINISGPLIKDKLWYRLSHEYIRDQEPIAAGTQTFVSTATRWSNSDQLTWQVSPRNKLAFQFQSDPYERKNWGVSALVPPESSRTLQLGGPQLSVTWTAPFSSKILAESVVSYQRTRENIFPTTTGVLNNCAVSQDENGTPLLPFVPSAQCTNLETGQTSGSYYLTWRDRRERLTVRSTGTFYTPRFLGVNHQLKMGFSVENERYFRDETRMPNIYYYVLRSNTDATSQQQSEKNLAKITLVIGNFAVPEISTARATAVTAGFFVEDQVKPLQNLTVTLGARVDREAVNSLGFQPIDPQAEWQAFKQRYATLLAQGDSRAIVNAIYQTFTASERIDQFTALLNQAIGAPYAVDGKLDPLINASNSWNKKRVAADVDLANTNISPILTVAWDPFSTGKWKFAFTARRYYDKVMLAVPLVEMEPTIATLRFETIEKPGQPPALTLGNNLNPAASVQTVDRNLKTPHSDELSLSVEHEIFTETTVKLTGIYKRYVDLIQTEDVNHYAADYGRCVKQITPKQGSWIDTSVRDGILDDCDGKMEPVQAGTGNNGGGGGGGAGGGEIKPGDAWVHRPDGFLDAYTYNVGWGPYYVVGNFNSTRYKAFILDVTRRMYRNWQMSASYTYSRAIGDAESWNSLLGDDRTTLENRRGYVGYDQRHVLKVNATTITPWGFRLGTSFTYQTGLPYSILGQNAQLDTPPVVPDAMRDLINPTPRVRTLYETGRRNDQRNEPYWTFDVKVTKEMNLPKGMNLQLSGDIFNLFNEKVYLIYNPFLGYGRQINGFNEAWRTIGRNYQISMKLSF